MIERLIAPTQKLMARLTNHELNPSHKMADEGRTITNAVREDLGAPEVNRTALPQTALEERTILNYLRGDTTSK